MLSKSKLIRGRQCHKNLWLYTHKKGSIEVDEALQAQFDSGSEVGKLAQRLFPEGSNAMDGLTYAGHASAKKTKSLIMNDFDTIYEATFIENDVVIAVDILNKNKHGNWDIYEVKGSSRVKPEYILDVAIQRHILELAGMPLGSSYVVHLNTDYKLGNELNVERLFTIEDISNKVDEESKSVPTLITEMRAVVDKKEEPDIAIGRHCTSPYTCPYIEKCWKHVPEISTLNLSGSPRKGWELYEQGIVEFKDIPVDFELNKQQQLQKKAVIENKPIINVENIKTFLDGLRYPIYHLDYETISPSIPLCHGCAPFDKITFQYSLHVQEHPLSKAKHFEFLADENQQDPREELIQSLISNCGSEGSVLVYHMSFEKGVTLQLAEDFPDYADDLRAIVTRMQDLKIPFAQHHYVHPKMLGRHTIKTVLPSLIPELTYDNLVIGKGDLASAIFLQMVKGNYRGDVKETRQDLLAYCKLDTLAMVKILDHLWKCIREV